MENTSSGPDGSEFTEGLGGWAKVPPEFTQWWNDDVLTPDNPFEQKTAAYWAWEGWQACKAVTLTDPDLRAGIALQLREIERLRADLAAVRAPLSDEQIAEISVSCALVTPSDIYFARAIEAAHGIRAAGVKEPT